MRARAVGVRWRYTPRISNSRRSVLSVHIRLCVYIFVCILVNLSIMLYIWLCVYRCMHKFGVFLSFSSALNVYIHLSGSFSSRKATGIDAVHIATLFRLAYIPRYMRYFDALFCIQSPPTRFSICSHITASRRDVAAFMAGLYRVVVWCHVSM